ncbi:hypothetical protein [Cryptosporangium minutisporangium]|uniref:Uncharacterized protein n=1 Tax=Cryptosporangium minutisporangium TaxID=113569 RepID=A0ABP6SZN9_9ACTN
MSPPVPPTMLLAHVLTALGDWLPRHFGPLLEADRFTDGCAVLARLATPEGAAAASGWLDPPEAARLTDLILARWAVLGPVEVLPLAVVVGPDESHHEYRLATYGLDDGWTARWSGPVTPAADGRTATSTGRDDPDARVTARVFGTSAVGRVILGAHEVRPAHDTRPAHGNRPAQPAPESMR